MGPLTNILTQVVEIFYMISVAGTIVIPPADTVFNDSKILTMIKQVQPTLIWATAKFYEKIFHQLRQERVLISFFKISLF